ncbi:MAG TPA: hypothetical protein VEK57_28890 [Thermoanaerobaculia bacterium]|nr:hypothetical protein [Thermoanaerobaculia bacterium]
MERHIEWTSPAALWDQFNGPTSESQRRVFRTPAILRFATDDFMKDFISVMENDPRRVSGLLAVPETWRKPAAETEVPRVQGGLIGALHRARTAAVRKIEARQGIVRTNVWNEAPPAQPLKFYQPAHQRYYLITAALVCRTVGLPDRAVDTTQQEKATFVLRMLQPPAGTLVNPDPASCGELAHVNGEWKSVTDGATLVEGETQYPLSPFSYAEVDGRKRRVYNGLIPVAKREELIAAKTPAPPGTTGTPLAPVDGRQMMLKTQVLGPWANLTDVARLSAKQVASTPEPAPDLVARAAAIAAARKVANEQIQTVSWFILLDLEQWLLDNLPDVHQAVIDNSSAELDGAQLAAFQALQGIQRNGSSLAGAMNSIRPSRKMLETVVPVYRAGSADWPTFLFQFVTATQVDFTTDAAQRASLEAALVAALPQPLPGAVSIAPRQAAQASATIHRSPWFTVRCVFERPNCTGVKPAVVSDPTASFQMAAFFDPDAPARPVRIAMPADTTPAGLRKFDKNTAFVMSDVLCGQVESMKGLSFADLIMAVLPFPLHKDLGINPKSCGPDGDPGGTVCSFSIPIITICALILLMIIVKLLDIIFFWMPFFQICLPLPKFDAKLEVKAEIGN